MIETGNQTESDLDRAITLIEQTGAGAVYWNRKYEPATQPRDATIKRMLREQTEKIERAKRIANEAADRLGLPERLDRSDLFTDQGYIGEGYGIPTPGGLEAIELLAKTEAVVLDPCYTSKAMAALIDHVRKGIVQPDQTPRPPRDGADVVQGPGLGEGLSGGDQRGVVPHVCAPGGPDGALLGQQRVRTAGERLDQHELHAGRRLVPLGRDGGRRGGSGAVAPPTGSAPSTSARPGSRARSSRAASSARCPCPGCARTSRRNCPRP